MMALTIIMPGLAPRLKLCVAYIESLIPLGNIYGHMTIDHRHGEDFSFGEIGHAIHLTPRQLRGLNIQYVNGTTELDVILRSSKLQKHVTAYI